MGKTASKEEEEEDASDLDVTNQQYQWLDTLTVQDEEFFDFVKRCNLPAVEELLTKNRVNINVKDHNGNTPLNLAIQNDCEPLVDLFLRQKDIQIGDSLLFAISLDNLKLLERLMDHVKSVGGDSSTAVVDSDEFPWYVTPLLLAAQCGRYETVMYLLQRGHKLDRPHPPRCACQECLDAEKQDDRVGFGCKRLGTYWAIANPTYVSCTSSADPILTCFRLYEELLDCGDVDQMYKIVYTKIAEQVKQFAVEIVTHCRTSDEVKVLLRNRDGCGFRGQFPYPRLITAMDHNQKEFVAHTNVQQVLESMWIGDWVEWKTYSSLRMGTYPLLRFVMSPLWVTLGVFAPHTEWNKRNRLPINRMFDSLVCYVVFLWLLYVQSNEDKFETPRGTPVSFTWVLIAVFVVGHAAEKIKLRTLQGPRRYFKNMWNVFDTCNLVLFTVSYLCWFMAGFQTTFVDVALDRKYWHWADPQLIAEALFAVATVMAYIRLLFLCQLSYYIAPMQVSLGKMLHVFLKFFVFLIIIMLAFTFGMGSLYRYYKGMKQIDPVTGQVTRQEDSFVTIPDTFRTLFWGMFGMSPLESPDVIIENSADDNATDADVSQEMQTVQEHKFTQYVGHGLFIVYEVLMVVVMLNTLIASVSNAFQRVVDSEYESLFGCTKVYVYYMLLDDLPSPFNLLSLVFSVFTRYQKKVSRPWPDYGAVVDDYGDDDDVVKSRTLTAELIKRYFTSRKELIKSTDK